MTEFKDLKSQWDSQTEINIPEDGAASVMTKVKAIKTKQQITNWVLSITSMVLIFFFFYINAYNNTLVTLGLFLMIGSLLVRIGIEFFSLKKLKELDITTDHVSFKQAMTRYYKNRITTHYIMTPVIFTLYIIGFVILLPFFKDSLSSGFYTYVIVSGIVVLVLLAILISKEIRKELKVLHQIKA